MTQIAIGSGRSWASNVPVFVGNGGTWYQANCWVGAGGSWVQVGIVFNPTISPTSFTSSAASTTGGSAFTVTAPSGSTYAWSLGTASNCTAALSSTTAATTDVTLSSIASGKVGTVHVQCVVTPPGGGTAVTLGANLSCTNTI